ncbi:hypothetical protein FRC06_011272, partial [Ceratobasidium sp. 370]
MSVEHAEPTPRRGERSRTRTQRAVDHDEDSRLRVASRENRRKKANIRAQHAANAAAAEESEEDESDDTPPSPPPTKTLSKSTKSSDEGKQRVSLSPAPPRKPTHTVPRMSMITDDEAARLKLVAQVAARDQRTDHFAFSIADLRLIWVNGDRLRNQESSLGGKKLFDNNNLKDLGTIDAPDNISRASLGKGKPAGKQLLSPKKVSRKSNGNLNVRVTASKESASRASSTSVRARSTSPTAISQRSSSVVSKRKTSAGSCTSKSARMPTHTYHDGSDELDSDASLYEDEDLGEIGDTEGEGSNRKAKPKMSDYPPDVGEILDATVEAVGAHLLARGWFLEARQYDCVILNMWRKKVAKLAPKRHRYPLTIRKMRL